VCLPLQRRPESLSKRTAKLCVPHKAIDNRQPEKQITSLPASDCLCLFAKAFEVRLQQGKSLEKDDSEQTNNTQIHYHVLLPPPPPSLYIELARHMMSGAETTMKIKQREREEK
jgi:hypothetical protein